VCVRDFVFTIQRVEAVGVMMYLEIIGKVGRSRGRARGMSGLWSWMVVGWTSLGRLRTYGL
jgi:hypothetical protein